ncbi:MAG: FHIPEP family type III secretion protein [Candidatus Eremiobacteraeota bacterium]|nr:FHIPEP family type III secretion protein [Candidatus Eremiobacteraeota bacterium]MCW5869428.1 FHIPEP family type III secretion protein [Candidatus Eremiobacteraeota bacterium]
MDQAGEPEELAVNPLAEDPDEIHKQFGPLKLSTVEVLLGNALIPLVEGENAALLESCKSIRRHIYMELGFYLPSVRFRNKVTLPANSYEITVGEYLAARGQVFPRQTLFFAHGPHLTALRQGYPTGTSVNDPVYSMPSIWIPDEEVVEPSDLHMRFTPKAVIATHLTEVARIHAQEIFARSPLDALLLESQEAWRQARQAGLTEAKLRSILGMLLRERVSIRDLDAVLLELALHEPVKTAPLVLLDFVRRRLAPVLYQKAADGRETLLVWKIDETQAALAVGGEGQKQQALHLGYSRLAAFREQQAFPTFVVASRYRRAWAELMRSGSQQVTVLALEDKPPEIRLDTLDSMLKFSGAANSHLPYPTNRWPN